MISLASIRLAIVVSRHSSFRRAAQELGLSPSIVSRRIRDLEDDLGVSLFERSSGGVIQTSAGRAFNAKAKAAVADLDYAIERAASVGRGVEGIIHIGVFGSLAACFLSELVGQFKTKHPDVEMEVSECAAGVQIGLVRQGRMDIAFVPGTAAIADCESLPAFFEEAFVALPVGHPLSARANVSWGDIRNETLIVRTQQPGPELGDYVARHISASQGLRTLRFDMSRENLINMVGLGFGIALA